MLISKALASFVVDLRFSQLSETTVNNARHCLMDALGVSIAASGLGESCHSFIESINTSAESPCTVFGFGVKTSCTEAAWANGALAHALDFEDAHDATLMHPNAAAIPAALAVCQQLGSMSDNTLPDKTLSEKTRVGKQMSGEQLIEAIVAGCEVTCRLASAIDQPLDDFGWYPPPIFGAFGATAAAGKLLGLNAEQLVNAFSITLCNVGCSAEIKYNPQSTIRAVRDAFSAQVGVQSAFLALRGVTGFAQPFEGKAGLFNNFARGQYTARKIVAGLGESFSIDTISFKPWPSCRGTHAFVEAAMKLVDEHNIVVDDIVTVLATGNRINRMLAEPLASKQNPVTAIDAKFSIPYTVAAALRFGDVRLEHFSRECLQHTDLRGLSSLVTYAIDPSLGDRPASMTTGHLEIKTTNSIYNLTINAPCGTPENPLSETALTEKFRQCCHHARKPMSVEKIETLIDSIKTLEQQKNLKDTFFQYLF